MLSEGGAAQSYHIHVASVWLTPALRLSTLAVACALTLTRVAKSQTRDPLVVSTSWLAAHLHDANLVLLHAGDRAEYDAKHIPGARCIQLLDGGMDAWTRDGNQVTSAVPPAAAPRTLAPLSVTPIVVDADYVKAHIAARGFSIVDARALEFYDGTQVGNGRAGPHKAGHIATAKSVPYTEITGDRLMVKPADQLNDLFAKAGIAPTDTVIGYCHIGQQATAMLFAARVAGHPVLLYDGSFDDWSRHSSEYAVENPAAKAKP